MKRIGWSLLALVLVSAGAHGFETKPGSAEAGKPGQELTAPRSNLGMQGQKLEKPSKGRSGFELPGFGNLGVLPKLDFGLELLYGEAPPAVEREDFKSRDADPEDLTIRGTFKHRF